MIKYTLAIIYLLLALPVAGQIALPTFTTYTTCPTAWSQMNVCPGWRQPTGGTSDYFNACASPAFVGVPQNYFGYQDSPDSAYAGLYTYAGYSVKDYKEYIAATFPPLTVGNAYTFSVYISLADSSKCATDGFGVFFSTYPYDESTWTTAQVIPQIDFSSYGVVADKTNWVTLTGTFVADSAYTDLMFGSFKKDSVINIDTLNDGVRDDAYYYFNQIALIDTNDIGPKDTTGYAFPNAFTPNGDGLNDVFRIIGKYISYDNYILNVYNRWGERVFFTHNYLTGWDGRHKGMPADGGVYFYFAEFTVKGDRKQVKGDVTLVR